MNSRNSILRLKRFEAEEKARKVEALESMIRDFDQMAQDLDRQILSEEERSGIRDPNHYAYSTFAKSAAQRRNNLDASIDDLKAKLELAQRDYEDAAEEVRKAEAADLRDSARTRRKTSRTPDLAVG